MNFYVTFGQRYRHELHPTGVSIDPDAVIKIEAESPQRAHSKAMDIFDGAFHRVLDEKTWQEVKRYYPHGVLENY